MVKLLAAALSVAALACFALGGVVGASSHAASTRTVSVGDDFYSPTRITIRRGTLVRWAWQGHTSDPHTVSDAHGHWSSHVKTSGTYSRRFRHAGRFTVICRIHPSLMRLRVTVRR